MKKRIIPALIILLISTLGWFIGSGFVERSDVYLKDYAVSPDGNEMTLNVGIAGSMGYTRGFKENLSAEKPYYMKFYSTFGGFNSSIGAKDKFVLKLYPTTTEIFFYHGEQGYDLVLQKDQTRGQWVRP